MNSAASTISPPGSTLKDTPLQSRASHRRVATRRPMDACQSARLRSLTIVCPTLAQPSIDDCRDPRCGTAVAVWKGTARHCGIDGRIPEKPLHLFDDALGRGPDQAHVAAE